eukprot:TRINITY_DN24144_c0_g2_i1.p2 TRINITY_DN24144_c0_g2~~TRINITY_DN24144_c0_g2_i1.p2  ORF type:complete len:102 (+),score=18.38 TRINITY_DN24144_c0_g2_i1:132-437(+)
MLRSLVGSEMCIRDRQKTGFCTHPPAGVAPCNAAMAAAADCVRGVCISSGSRVSKSCPWQFSFLNGRRASDAFLLFPGKLWPFSSRTVSYTHLTLPTKRIV